MIHYRLPCGKKGAVTFSYDDGPDNDARLIELFRAYNVKGTFHLNGRKYLDMTDAEKDAVRRQYEGFEISSHTLHHGMPTMMPNESLISETMEDRRILEEIAGYPVCGMSYPYGDYNDSVIAVLRSCGMLYSRTVGSEGSFRLPLDFMRWNPTCHHRNALGLVEKFNGYVDNGRTYPVFYIWGHSFEFRTEEDWAQMEELLRQLSGRDEIWYASNIEIYNYAMALRQLRVSADEKRFFNPTACDVWVEPRGHETICIPAGQTVQI